MSNEITRIIANTAYQTYEKRLFKEVMEGTIPEHVAIIMDGNRRFAQEIGLAVHEGHVKGKDKLEEVMEWCQEMGIRVLTVFAFSTENLQRDEGEVQCLMDLFEESFLRLAEDERIHENRCSGSGSCYRRG